MEQKDALLAVSQAFWAAMEHADAEGMRRYADPACRFVHIGVTCGLEQEIGYYTSGQFQPTELRLNSQQAALYGDTAVVLTDCNYGLLLDGKPTTHHFAVTEVYARQAGQWRLVQFTFTALVY